MSSTSNTPSINVPAPSVVLGLQNQKYHKHMTSTMVVGSKQKEEKFKHCPVCGYKLVKVVAGKIDKDTSRIPEEVEKSITKGLKPISSGLVYTPIYYLLDIYACPNCGSVFIVVNESIVIPVGKITDDLKTIFISAGIGGKNEEG